MLVDVPSSSISPSTWGCWASQGINIHLQVLYNGADGVAGGPYEEAVGQGFQLLGTVRFGKFGFDVFVGDFLDHGFGADGDGFFLEGGFGVVNQLLGEHGKDVGQRFDKGDVEVVGDVRDPFLEVLFEEVLEFAGELNACGAAANDHHVQKTFAFLVGLVFEARSFDAVHNALADLLGVADFFEKAGVFADTGDAKGSVFSTDAYDEHVKRNFGG